MNRNVQLGGLLLLLVLCGVWFFQDSADPAAPAALTGLQRTDSAEAVEEGAGALPEAQAPAVADSSEARVDLSEPSAEVKRARAEKAAQAKATPTGPWLKGVVLSVHGAPVKDVEVTIRGEADAGLVKIPAFSETTRTDARGEFKITRGLWPALPLKVDVKGKGYELFNGDAFPERQTGDEFLGEFRIQPGVILGGLVLSHDGSPVAGATVWRGDPDTEDAVPEFMQMAQKMGRFSPGATETDEEGRFELPHEPEGDYALHAIHDHHREAVLKGTSLPAGTSENRLVIEFEESATISGRIVGMKGKSAGIMVEAKVKNRRDNDVPTSMIAAMGLAGAGGHKSKLGSDGSFTIYGLPLAETFEVQAFAKQGIMNRVPCSDAKEADSGASGVELQWNGGASVSFAVEDAITGKPIPNGAVRYRWVDSKKSLLGNARKVHNFESHRVTIDELRPDPSPLTMELRVFADGYLTEGKEGIQVRAFEKHDLGTIRLHPCPKFRVQVLEAATGEPIRRARVVLYPIAGEDAGEELFNLNGKPSTGKTDRQGWCELDVQSSELARLSVRRRGFAPFDLDDIRMSRGEDQTQIVRLHPGAVITVEVTDSLGQEAAGIQVAHRDLDSGEGRRETDRNGRVVYKDLAPGEHSFRALPRLGNGPRRRGGVRVEARTTPDGGGADEPVWEVVQVGPGTKATISLQLDPTATLSGVVMRRGAPVPHAKVRFIDEAIINDSTDQRAELEDRVANFGGQKGSGTTTDGQGHFTLNELPMGKSSLRVKTPDGGPAHFEPIELFEGSSFVTVKLPGSAVEGKVVDQDGNPVSGATLTLRRMKEGEEDDPWGNQRLEFALDLFGGKTGDASKSDDGGQYLIDGIPEGQLLGVEARATGYVRAVSATFKAQAESSVRAETIRLQRAGSVRATIEGGLPMFMTCTANRVSEEGPGPRRAVAMSQEGHAIFTDLAPGEWTITTREEGEAPVHKGTVEVIAGERVEVVLHP